MTSAALALVAEFESAAKATRAAEEELRRKLTAQIASMERQRAFAFRRTRLIRSLASAAHADIAENEAETEAKIEAKAWSRQRQAVREELGWSGESQAYDAILMQLRPVASAVWRCACASPAEAGAAVLDELEKFEAWFEGAHGKSFYALFDQYAPEVPVVDF